MPQPGLMRDHRTVAVIALVLTLTGCGSESLGPPPAAQPRAVKAADLEALLLSNNEIDAIMGSAMTPLTPVVEMADNRNLLPNLNCLGVWQVNEVAIYGQRGTDNWMAMRQQTMREPDSEHWRSVAVQSVVLYESPEAARDFVTKSNARWAECTDHRVNITLNDKPLPRWLSGALDATDTRLTIPITRGSDGQIQSCEHVLAVRANVVIDVQACKPQDTPVTQAGEMTTAIESHVDAITGA